MAYAKLETLARRVRGDLERLFEGRPARLAEALRHLLETMVTAEVPEPLQELCGEVRGLKTHLRALRRHLQEASSLPEALCARYKYRMPEGRARRRYRVSPRVWRHVHELAREVGWRPELQVPLIRYEAYAWHDALEEQFVQLEVLLDAGALEGVLIASLEAYLSPRKPRRKGSEVYGICFGMTREVHHRRFRDGLCVTRYVSVMRAQPQLSADSGYGHVEPNPRSLDAILKATTALYPQYQAVGDFHSHPYDELWVLDRDRGWDCTPSDDTSNVLLARAMSELGHHMSVAFVIGIARSSQRAPLGHYRGLRNTLQLGLGNCRVIVAAYRSLESGRLTGSNTRLSLSGTLG